MDRNTIAGFSLIFLILIGYYYYTAPSAQELAKMAEQNAKQISLDSAKKVSESAQQIKEEGTQKSLIDSTQIAISSALQDTALRSTLGEGIATQSKGKEEIVLLKSKELSVEINSKGAYMGRVVLNTHKNFDSSALELLSSNTLYNKWFFEIYTTNGALNSSDFYWKVIQKTERSVTLRLGDSLRYIDQQYALSEDGYTVHQSLVFKGIDQIVQSRASGIKISWRAQLQQHEKQLKWEMQNSTVVYKLHGEDADYLSTSEPEEEKLKNNLDWFGFKQQYFSAIMVADSGFSSGSILSWKDVLVQNKDRIKDLNAEVYVDFDRSSSKTYGFSYYLGPNQYHTLKNADVKLVDAGLERTIPMGWGIFGWVNRYVVIPVFHQLDGVIASMGIIILLLTLIIKTALLPLVYKSYMSTAKMRILKPELDAIKEKHGSDMQKTQQENMAMYRKAGVNPLSGCIPVLLQMPILFAMFQFFPNAFELRQKSFLWAADLSRYDGPMLGFTIPFYGDHVSYFTLLMTVSTLIYTHFNNQLSGITGQMKWIGYFMPIIFLGVLNDYASGLTWYYFLSNMITFGQQWVIRRTVDDNKLHAQIAENRKKPVTKSKFQQRMQDAMKLSQERANSTKGKKR
ncbi:MAG: membrane protein insertase YidC [Flavobacteriales bacterium]|nr:MAG: membrane protein insertase YidC [Flavobacteriales bacterium]